MSIFTKIISIESSKKLMQLTSPNLRSYRIILFEKFTENSFRVYGSLAVWEPVCEVLSKHQNEM